MTTSSAGGGGALERLRAARVIAVLRTPDGDSAVRAAEALRRARELLPGDVVVGAGTIRDRARLDAALDAGAEFLVSPHLDRELFPDVQVVPTGGIGPADVRPWLDAGAIAVGASGELCPSPLVAAGRWDEPSAAAERYLAA